MRSIPTFSLALVACLLVEEVLASPPYALRHNHRHRRDLIIDTVTDEVTETVWSTVYVTIGEDGQTEGVPAATTAPTTPATVTSLLVSSTTTSPSAVVSSPSSEAAVFFQEQAQQSTTAETASPTTSAAAVPQTTLATFVSQNPSTTTASVASETSSSATNTTSSSNKRGLAYNTASLLTNFVSSDSQISWAYNWAQTSSGLDLSGVEYVSMLWGLGSSFTEDWSESATSAIEAGSLHLLCFNEPDLATQSNIGYAEAATGYIQYMQPFAGKAQLGAPAVTNGAAPMGLTWLGNFLDSCSDCTIDFCPIHWYDSATNFAYLQSYVAEAITTCNGKPIWLTEFAGSGTIEEQVAFLKEALPWLDSQPLVERYAYFMASDGILLNTGDDLSELGTVFATYA